MSDRNARMVLGARHVGVLIGGLVFVLLLAAHSAAVTVTETGSTLIIPLFKAWVAAYAKVDPDTHITVGATDSGTGIAKPSQNRCRLAHPTPICPIRWQWLIRIYSTSRSPSPRRL